MSTRPVSLLATTNRRRLVALGTATLAIASLGWPPVAAHAQPVSGASAAPSALSTITVRPRDAGAAAAYDGVVEAVRQTVIAAQVSGAVVQIDVKVGDRVKAGQLLMRLDARAADQSMAASQAQVQAARAQLEVASRDVQRQRQLFEQNYISRAALDRAEAEFQATKAQVESQLAQAGVAQTQTTFHLVRAPYAGVVSEVPVSLGDMALPGRPLVTVYDPGALRVNVPVPQSVAARLGGPSVPPAEVKLEFAALPAERQWVTPTRVQQLPTIDAATHTATLRAELPPDLEGVAPGMFARAWIAAPRAAAGGTSSHVTVPLSAVVRRAEMTALYVVDGTGRPLLRQVRLGRSDGQQVEVLAGLSAGEQVATDPQAAARVR